MVITMDRYGADWPMVERGWAIHVRGEGRSFASARAAIETYREEDPDRIDQDLPPFVIARDGAPLGPVVDGDAVILFNFRGDRAMELSRAFEDDDFPHFDREPRPDVLFAGMMQYDGDLGIPGPSSSIPRRSSIPWESSWPRRGSASSRSPRPRSSAT